MFTQLTIKTRLLLLGVIAVSGVIFGSVLGIGQLRDFNLRQISEFQELRAGVREMLGLQAANVEFKTQVQEWKNILIRGDDPAEFAKYKKSFQGSATKVQDQLSEVARLMKEGSGIHAVDVQELVRLHAELNQHYAKEIAAWDSLDPDNTPKADHALKGKDRAMTEAMSKLVAAMQSEQLSKLEQQSTEMQARYTKARNLLLVLALLILAIVAVLVSATSIAISSKINSLQDVLHNVSHNLDLSLRLPDRGADEISTVSRSINGLLGEFRVVLTRMKEAAGHVSHASGSVSHSVLALSDAVNQQNEATSSMAAAAEELAVSVTHVASSSARAQQISQQSQQRAQNGSEVIGQTVSGMAQMAEAVQATAATIEDLGRRSQEIGGIAGSIKEIAEQTNLLALNAAIEAARAGEQGRGFAVVADEVRKLAERTSGATAEIAGVIGAIQSDTQKAVVNMQAVVVQVNERARLAREAGDAIVLIREGSGEVVEVTTDISIALQEQSEASEQIAKQVERIATMSDENTTALVDVKDASREMKQLSDEMQQMVERFRL